MGVEFAKPNLLITNVRGAMNCATTNADILKIREICVIRIICDSDNKIQHKEVDGTRSVPTTFNRTSKSVIYKLPY